MAHVSGPTSSMPGSSHDPNGTMCDNHADRQAVSRIQGETDSFGAEFEDLCAECLAKLRAEKTAGLHDDIGSCDWCKDKGLKLFPTRDFEEGLAGPVYRVCQPCKSRHNAALAQEWDDSSDWD